MAYADPTFTITTSPSSPVNNQPFTIIATMASGGDVGVKFRRGQCVRISGPSATFSEYEFPSGTGTDSAPKFAGANKPSTADYVANAGSAATTVMRFNAVAFQAGTLRVQVLVNLTEDSGGTDKNIMSGGTDDITIA